MGYSRSPAELAVKLGRYADGLRSGETTRAAVEAAAFEYKRTIQVFMRTASGGDLRLSGVGRTGAKIGVRYENPVGRVNVTATVRAVGPAHLIERPTKAGAVILPKGVGRARGRTKEARRAAKQQLYDALFGGGGNSTYAGAKPLRTPYGPRYRVVRGATRGKYPFERGAKAAEKPAQRAFQAQIAESLRDVFGG